MNRIDLEFGDLQAYVAVAERLSVRAAADQLFISQPALSRRMDKLGAVLDVRLPERTSRGVAVTAAGRQFLEHARAAIAEMQVALGSLSAVAAQRSSMVTVACVGVAAVPALAYSRERYPALAAVPLVPLVAPTVQRSLGLIARKGDALSAPAQALYDLLEAAAARDFVFPAD